MNTAYAHKQMHSECYTPIRRVLVTYQHENKSHAFLYQFNGEGKSKLNRLIAWAIHNGVELTIRSV